MNYLNEKEITFDQLKKTALKHYNWALICFIFLICIEIFFFAYPPRGYVAENFIVLGSIKGQTLLPVEELWQNKVKDDKFMLDIFSESKIKKLESTVQKLKFINTKLLPNLHFAKLNPTLFKISFIQSSPENIRSFLNTFTRKFLQEVALISNEKLKKSRRNAKFSYQQLLRRSRLLHRFLTLKIPFDKIIPNQKGQLVNISPEREDSLFGQLGLIVINELNKQLFKAQIILEDYTDEKQAVLSLFPFTHKSITDPATPPKTVQPYLFAFYIFIATAVFLVYLSGLFYFLPSHTQEKA